ncbi:hypothetical protein [Haloflavibacter putidus]|uniref:Uncharacterized protein n=1 Tax=Haloflavibacter putidus TaxID=2576776 RepID=A0A507ZTZ1_9FLAO|nr:hypothetical protein [Haloflavibacter putidus]TQD40407.1 hypothetical protein FKR84_00055 [Haloflavibacter putidus]
MKFSKEFKEAVLHLSEKEKDKLLIRLLKKDKNLVNQLYFELLDDKSLEDRRELIEEQIRERGREIAQEAKSLNQLKVLTSFLSGDIAEHVRTTKDKFGEISLTILLLTTVIKNAEELFEKTHPVHAQKFCIYVIARSFKILVLLQKMHEDILLEFEDSLPELGKAIASEHLLMKTAINHGLDVNWLILENNIPEDIAEIQKEVKRMGFLR